MRARRAEGRPRRLWMSIIGCGLITVSGSENVADKSRRWRCGLPAAGRAWGGKEAMSRTRRDVLGLLAIGAAAIGCASFVKTGGAAEEPAFPVTPLTLETGRGRFGFMVEMAETPSTWQQGLQRRRHLATDAGMLFNFQQPRVISMWMKDTLISLDMIFIDERGAVVNVAENTVPLSLVTISSHGPVLAVLEVNAGTVARLGVRPGDRVLHPLFALASRAAPAR
jgi:uncharacterized protein